MTAWLTLAGRLPGYKVGGRRVWRFRVEDVDAWLQQPEVIR